MYTNVYLHLAAFPDQRRIIVRLWNEANMHSLYFVTICVYLQFHL